MITILLTNYKRQFNIDKIITALRSQTVPCELFLWNNATENFEDDRVDWIVNSSNNVRCWPRWSMAAFAKYPYLMTHDDDFCFTSEDCLEVLIREFEANYIKGRALGFTGVRLGKDGSYFPTESQKQIRKMKIYLGAKHLIFPKQKKEVDIIKGRLLLCKNEDLHNLPNYTDVITYGDDIFVSSFLASGKRMHHLISPVLNEKIEELEGGDGEMALSSHKDWEMIRTNISKKYFS